MYLHSCIKTKYKIVVNKLISYDSYNKDFESKIFFAKQNLYEDTVMYV